MCFVFSTTLPENVLVLSRIERDMIINVYWSSCKVQVILVRFYLNKNFLDIFSKNTQILNYMKIRPAGAERIHADGRTDMTKLIVAFRNFVKPPTNSIFCAQSIFMSFVWI